MAQQFEDKFHRKFYYLRLSVTDVCNFKCTYCLPDGYKPSGNKNSSFLSLPEIKRVVKAFADCGTSKVRITGGEPSLRKDFTDIIHSVATTPGIKKSPQRRMVTAWRGKLQTGVKLALRTST